MVRVLVLLLSECGGVVRVLVLLLSECGGVVRVLVLLLTCECEAQGTRDETTRHSLAPHPLPLALLLLRQRLDASSRVAVGH